MANFTKANKRTFQITLIGMATMAILSSTKIIPETSYAGVSVPIGILFFFLIDNIDKGPHIKKGVRLNTFFSDMKKPWVIPLVLLPVVTAIASVIIGDAIFKGMYTTHIIGRSDAMLSYDKIPLLMLQLVIAALTEEIAWRGFFLGKSMRFFPFWVCAFISALLFAIAHIAVGDFGLVFYDVFTIFINSIIYAIIYKKSESCLVTTVSHILCNSAGIAFFMIFMK
ncbi:CPBP family intramembrane glutamic endopeptidase [uncultured Abiotrophia sp.]|uniref:CPBP family intramembrane glutamic endopeptidase n=1 Tax=uncultured Abiotrophia sp. TaxID=316094 RepID=UPI0028E96C60|nr:CPBP family intramembrane glutamic endopeptidase [uncultured Abiotrophia sp.]